MNNVTVAKMVTIVGYSARSGMKVSTEVVFKRITSLDSNVKSIPTDLGYPEELRGSQTAIDVVDVMLIEQDGRLYVVVPGGEGIANIEVVVDPVTYHQVETPYRRPTDPSFPEDDPYRFVYKFCSDQVASWRYTRPTSG